MKTKCSLFFRKVFPFLILFFALALNLMAQPQYYNFNTTGANNSFPFGIAGGKMLQALVVGGEFNQPSPSPSGNITKFYYRVNELYPFININYSFLYIRMGQANITTLPTGAFYTGTMDTVFKGTNYLINAAGGTWVTFNLTTPFAYDNTQGLIIEIGNFGFSGTNFFPACNTNLTGNRRSYSVGGSPFVYSGQGVQMMACGVDVAPPASTGPNYLYYKFENNPNATTVLNCAIPGVGTPTAVLGAGTPLTAGGQFDTCITGTGLSTGGITTGWNCNLGTSSWTINFWLTTPTETDGLAYYLFGDAGSGSFRCFHNGVALPNNLVLRGGFTDITVTGTGPNPTSVTFVYDSAAGNVKAYKNGVLAVTSVQTLNIITGTGFKVGGYGTSPSVKGKLDEFRLYRRALSAAEVLTTYNSDLSGCGVVGINNTNNQIPGTYTLSQNYPNPFNPTTNFIFALPKAGYVDLRVYDALGREAASVVSEFKPAGIYTVEFNASNLASGVYFYTLRSGDFTATKKMVLIK